VLALLLFAHGAAAHALPQSSDPAANAVLTAAPAMVTIRFGEAPDPALSSIRVLDSTGAPQTAGPSGPVAGDPLSLQVQLKPLVNGVYTVAWRTVSSVDGHLASGTFAFGVGVTPPPAGTPSDDTGAAGGDVGNASPLAILARWLFLGGLFLTLGSAIVELVIFRTETRTALALAGAGLVGSATGAGAILLAEVQDTGIDLSTALGSSLGASSLARLVPLVLGGAGLAVLLRRPRSTSARGWTVGWWLVAAAAAGSMLAETLASHAAAGPLPLLNVPVQAVHLIAGGTWLGGLAALVTGLRGAPGAEHGLAIRRFSLLATAGIGLTVGSGVLRAAAELSSLSDLLGTDFGRLLVAKGALVACLAGLGAVNHFRHVPRGEAASHPVQRVGSLELGVAVCVLLLTASLVNLAPPVETAAAAAAAATAAQAPLLVSGADFGTTLRLDLQISPGGVGFNTYQASVTDYDSSEPVEAAGVTLRFSLPARPDLGGSTLRLTPGDPGIFTASGANLSLTGDWSITALVDRGPASVEIPLTVLLRPAPQVVDVDAEPGLPTIYTVHLGGGLTVQVYLDPGTAGPNDVHATFFDATGTELPVLGATISVTGGAPAAALSPGGAPAGASPSFAVPGGPGLLQARMLEPGHFIGSSDLAAGIYTVEVAGPAPDGSALDAVLQVTVSP
jgi:copper transport protein